MIDLRPRQQIAIDMARQSFATGHQAPLIVASCGFGKTRVSAAICASAMARGKRVLFLTPRRGLTFQSGDSFENLGISSGTIMSGVEHDNRHMVDCASIDTVLSRINVMSAARLTVEAADLIIVDECDMMATGKRREFFLDIKNGKYGEGKRILGLTATPCLTNGGGLGAIYDDLLIPATMLELIGDSHLLPVRYYSAETPDVSGVGISDGDYIQSQLGEAYGTPKIMGSVLNCWHEFAYGLSTVIFTPTRKNAAQLVLDFLAAGISTEYLDAKTSDEERAAIYQRVMDGITTVIINCGIVSVGVDIPRIQCVVMALKTRSVRRWMQAVGRCQRLYGNQDYGVVIDHGAMCLDPAMGAVEDITDWTLEEKGKVQDRIVERKQKTKERKDIKCPSCSLVFKSAPICPECGAKMETKIRGEAIEYHDIPLREIVSGKAEKETTADKRNRTTPAEEKRKFYGEVLEYVMNKGGNPGRAAHIYRSYYGCWPNAHKDAPRIPPSEETLSYIKSQAIRHAKSRKTA